MALFVVPERHLEVIRAFVMLPSFPVTVLYLLMVSLGGYWKRICKPLSLRAVLVGYNFLCVLLSAAAFTYFIYGCYINSSLFYRGSNEYLKIGFMLYRISKFLELMDTVFMLIRHKYQQISFLHVYHHSTILLLGDYCYQYTPMAPIAVIAGLNSLVHVFMYTYYGQAALTSSQRPHWKKAITQFQIAQFLVAIVYSIVGYLHHGFCIYSPLYGFSMLALFSTFYYSAYIKRKDSTIKKKEK